MKDFLWDTLLLVVILGVLAAIIVPVVIHQQKNLEKCSGQWSGYVEVSECFDYDNNTRHFCEKRTEWRTVCIPKAER